MLARMSSLAVVIPLYNHATYIAAAMQSVYAQTRAADRVIVIDDGSTDDSFAAAKKCARQGTELVRQENMGAHAVLNRGIEMAADCDFVAILNSDDTWHPERLYRCRAELTARSEIGAVCTGLHLVDSAGTHLAETTAKVRRHRQIWTLVKKQHDPLLSLAISNFTKSTSNLVGRQAFFAEHPFGPYRYIHDYHWVLQAALQDRLGLVPDDLLAYRVHESNTIKANGRRAVVAETVQMHLDILGGLAPAMAGSARLRERIRHYLQCLLGNHTDFRGQLFFQVIAEAIARQPDLFSITSLGDYEEFEGKSSALP